MKNEISVQEFREFVNKPVKQNKYKNKKVAYDGLTFDSQKEWRRYVFLKQLVKENKINSLSTQVPFEIIVNKKNICKYISDFTYYDSISGKLIVEDVKSEMTRKLSTYRLKKRLVEAIHGIEIIEV